MKTAILCGKLFDSATASVQENMIVLIEDKLITEVRPGTEAPEGCEVVDLRGCFVTPGLIDAHVHLESVGNESPDESAYILPGELTIRAVRNARADLMAGFTTVRDCGGSEYINHSVRDAIARGDIEGPRVFSAGRCITSTGGHADSHFSPYIETAFHGGIRVDGAAEARRAARHNIKYGADFLKVMATGGVMSRGTTVGSQQLTADELEAVVEIAGMYGIHTAAHAHGTAGIKAAARAGITSVEHAMMMDDEAVDLFCEKGTYHTPTIIAAERIIVEGPKHGLIPWMVDKAKQVFERHEWGVREGLKRGVRFTFGTDSGTPFNFHGRQAYEFELMQRFGFTPVQALIAATRTNAVLLGMSDRIGKVEKGCLADLSAFRGNPLEDVHAFCDCTFVMKEGKIYKHE